MFAGAGAPLQRAEALRLAAGAGQAGQVPGALRQSMLLWVGCIAGALEEQDYRGKLAAAGFVDVDLEPTRIYNIEHAWGDF